MFLSGLTRISITAFLCSFKAYRRNSLYYSKDTLRKTAKALGMSLNTFKKYFNCCIDLGYIEVKEAGTKLFIALKKALPKLFPQYFIGKRSFFRHIHFFAGLDKIPNFKVYAKRIKYAIAKTNFNQQQYQLERKDVVNRIERNRPLSGDTKKLKALMKKHNVTCFQSLKRILSVIDYIITGKAHLANLLRCSTTTAARLLHQWAYERKYTRTIIVHFLPMFVCPDSHKWLISLNIGVVIPNKQLTGYWINVGSKIDPVTG